MSRGKVTAEIAVNKKGERYVLIALPDGRSVEAYITARGIHYTKPEWVPRVLKQTVVPGLIKKIREMTLHGE